MNGLAAVVPESWVLATSLRTPLLAAAIAGVVALFGILVTQWQARRSELMRSFAEALEAVAEFRELPYRVHHRVETPDARMELMNQIADAHIRLAFNDALMRLGPRKVATDYWELACAVRKEVEGLCAKSWRQGRTEGDARMLVSFEFPNTDSARQRCLHSMRKKAHHLEKSTTRVSTIGPLESKPDRGVAECKPEGSEPLGEPEPMRYGVSIRWTFRPFQVEFRNLRLGNKQG